MRRLFAPDPISALHSGTREILLNDESLHVEDVRGLDLQRSRIVTQ